MNEISFVATSKADAHRNRIQMIRLLFLVIYTRLGAAFIYSEMKTMIKLFRIGSDQWNDAPLEPLTQPQSTYYLFIFYFTDFKALSLN